MAPWGISLTEKEDLLHFMLMPIWCVASVSVCCSHSCKMDTKYSHPDFHRDVCDSAEFEAQEKHIYVT